MSRFQKAVFRWGFALSAGAVMFQLSSCTPGNIGRYVAGLNPCGSILNCDPLAYTFLTSGYRGPGVDPDVDPFCTFPPFCSAAQDPIISIENTP